MKRDLKQSTAKLLPEWVSNDLSYTVNDGTLIFLTNVWPSGHVMGWYSHSPWGCVHDKEQGWYIVSPDQSIYDTCESKIDGLSTGQVRDWRKKISDMLGRSYKLADEFTNELVWRKEYS